MSWRLHRFVNATRWRLEPDGRAAEHTQRRDIAVGVVGESTQWHRCNAIVVAADQNFGPKWTVLGQYQQALRKQAYSIRRRKLPSSISFVHKSDASYAQSRRYPKWKHLPSRLYGVTAQARSAAAAPSSPGWAYVITCTAVRNM